MVKKIVLERTSPCGLPAGGSSVLTETMTYPNIDYFIEPVTQRAFVVDVSDADNFGKENLTMLIQRQA